MRVVDATLLGIVGSAPLLIGGTPPLIHLGLVTALLALFVLVVLRTHLHREPWAWHPISVVMAVFGFWTLAQASAATAPLAASITSDAFTLWGLPSRIAIAPGRAPLSALTWFAYAATVQMWTIRFPSSRATVKPTLAIITGGTLALLVGFLQEATDATRILGVYTPQLGVLNPLAGPFVNANQAGSMLALTLILSLVAAIESRKRERVAVATAFVFGGLFLLWTGLQARGALVGLLVGLAVVVVAQLLSPNRELRLLGQGLLGAVAAAAAALALVVYSPVGHHLTPVLDTTGVGKLAVWRHALRLVQQAPLAGYGAGGFGDVYANVAPVGAHARYTFVESGPLQMALNVGAPLMVLFLATLLWTYRRWFARRGVPDRSVALLGLAVAATVGVDAILGMGLEAPGYAIPVVALVGMLAARTTQTPETYRPTGPGLALTLLVGVALTVPGLATSVRLGHQGLDAPVAELSHDEAESAALALARHTPGDFALIVNATWHAIHRQDPWSHQGAAYLTTHAPAEPWSWTLAFIDGYASGDMDGACAALGAQARLGNVSREVDYLLLDPQVDFRQWQRCIEGDDVRATMYRALLRADRHAAALAVANAWLADAPDDPAALDTALRSAHALELDALATSYALAVLADDEVRSDSATLALRTLRTAGMYHEALTAVDRLIALDPTRSAQRLDRVELLVAMARREEAPGGWAAAARGDLESLSDQLAGHDGLRRRRLQLARGFYRQQEDWAALSRTLEALLRHRPNDPALLVELGEAAEAQRQRSLAVRYYRRALSIDPGHAPAQARLEALQR